MSLLTVALLVFVGYVIVLAVAVALLKAARHADDAAERQHAAAVRSMTEEVPTPAASEQHRGRRFARRVSAR